MWEQVSKPLNAIGMVPAMLLFSLFDQLGSDPSHPLTLIAFLILMVPVLMIAGAGFDMIAQRHLDEDR